MGISGKWEQSPNPQIPQDFIVLGLLQYSILGMKSGKQIALNHRVSVS